MSGWRCRTGTGPPRPERPRPRPARAVEPRPYDKLLKNESGPALCPSGSGSRRDGIKLGDKRAVPLVPVRGKQPDPETKHPFHIHVISPARLRGVSSSVDRALRTVRWGASPRAWLRRRTGGWTPGGSADRGGDRRCPRVVVGAALVKGLDCLT